MAKLPSLEYSLSVLAHNGLRRGRTTGSCATAAVKAALIFWRTGEAESTVAISLPDNLHYLIVPIKQVERLDGGAVRAVVVKYAGDDPDQTDGALISATLRTNGIGKIRFFAGEGVGIVTRPGIRVAVGEPAINPGPRKMILEAVEQVCKGFSDSGFDITIGCANGKKIALKTFNPRLGIEGGISILGTTGIVEPMSLAAYQASIEVYVRVALAELPTEVAYLPGNIGINFAKNKLALSPRHIVHISNFLGASLDASADFLEETKISLSRLWLLGHPGKLAKVLEDVWDTHSNKSAMAMSGLAKLAEEQGYKSELVSQMRGANTVEAIIDYMGSNAQSRKFWQIVEQKIGTIIQTRLSKRTKLIGEIAVRLFSMNGTALGGAI